MAGPPARGRLPLKHRPRIAAGFAKHFNNESGDHDLLDKAYRFSLSMLIMLRPIVLQWRNSCVLPLTVTDPCLEVNPYMTFEGDCVAPMEKHVDVAPHLSDMMFVSLRGDWQNHMIAYGA